MINFALGLLIGALTMVVIIIMAKKMYGGPFK